jgi:hypothetical protein
VRLGNFDTSSIANDHLGNILLASIDAARQLLACETIQRLLIPVAHFDDEPSKNVKKELAKVAKHMEKMVIPLDVEPLTDRKEVGSLGVSQAFEKGFLTRLNANAFSRDLQHIPFQRFVLVPFNSVDCLFFMSRAVVVGCGTILHEFWPENFHSQTSDKTESGP